MKKTIFVPGAFLFLFVFFVLPGCDSSSSSSDSKGIQFNTVADFKKSASASSSLLPGLIQAMTTATCDSLPTPITSDAPDLADGLDCDKDGGVVSHITPSRYLLAFKRVSLIGADGTSQIDFVADTGTLAKSAVISFTNADSSDTIITVEPASLKAGSYSRLQAEIYYFELTFPVGGVTRNVRFYMSDDDFASEGSLGHHQGDITFMDDAENELGWIDSNWNDTLDSKRGEAQNGAGGVDAESGHARGFFGNASFWNTADLKQGSGKDIYIYKVDFDSPLVIPDPSTISDLTTITATFSVADTFYYEDFPPRGTGFSPEPGAEANNGEFGEWAPLPPMATLQIE